MLQPTLRKCRWSALVSPCREFWNEFPRPHQKIETSSWSTSCCKGQTRLGPSTFNIKSRLMQKAIHDFLNGCTYAVAGASTNRAKFGNQVFQALVKSGRTTYPLNPTSNEVEGHAAYAKLADLPESLSVLPSLLHRQSLSRSCNKRLNVESSTCGFNRELNIPKQAVRRWQLV